MICVEISDEKILAYIEETYEISLEGCLIRDKFLEDEKWKKLEQKTLQRLRECPGDAFTMDALGHHYLKRKQCSEAIEMYKQALKHSTTPASIQHHIVFAYYSQGDIKRTLEEFRKIDVKQLNKEGMYSIDWNEYKYLDGDSFVTAIPPLMSEEEQFEEALQFTINTLMHNANMYTQMGVFDFVIDCYQELLQLMPKAPCILNKLGVACIRAERYKEAKKALTEAIKYNPGLDDAYYNLGLAHINLEEYELAIGILKKGSIRFEDDHEIWLELAKTYLKIEHQQKAIDCLVRALQAEIEKYTNLTTVPEIQLIIQAAHEQYRSQK